MISATASYRESKVVVEYDPDLVTPDQIAGAINTQTYFQATGVVSDGDGAPVASEPEPGTGELASAVIRVEGMSDNRAVGEVMSAMRAGDAIVDATFDLAAATLTIRYDASKADASTLALAITDNSPYRATVLSSTEPPEDADAAARAFDYARYAVWGLAGLLAIGLAWSGLAWTRRRLAGGPGEPANRRRRGPRGRQPPAGRR